MPFSWDDKPYTNFHELNLDWFINKFKEIFEEWESLYNQLTTWKNTTDAELEAWKTAREADIEGWETATIAALDAWKTTTETDIGTWETATLAALDTWKTAAEAAFEAIRVQAAASATAAAGSATDAETAKTAAIAAQTAAETAAASVTASAAQIATNTNDITELKTQLEHIKTGYQNYVEDYGLNTDGTLIATTGVCTSDFIRVAGGHTVTATCAAGHSSLANIRLLEYKADKETVNDYWSSNPYKTTVLKGSTAYVRISFVKNYNATLVDDTENEEIYKAEIIPPLNDIIEDIAEGVSENAVQNADYDEIILDVSHDPKTNYIDKTKITSGYINANGVYTPYNSLWCTDFIPMSPGEVFYHGNAVYGGNYYAFYDSEYNVVAAGGTLGDLQNPFTVPQNAVYGRFTIQSNPATSTAATWIFTQNGVPDDYVYLYEFDENMAKACVNAVNNTTPTNYEMNDIQAFRTGICIGDSLTEGVFNYNNSGTTGYTTIEGMSYPDALHRITGIDITNKGNSGLTSLEWYTANQSTDLSGHQFAIILFGVNDVARYGQGFTSDSESGYNSIISKLKSENENIKIFISTVMPAVSYDPANYSSFNAGLKTFIESLNDPNIVVLDEALYGNTAPQQYNAGHLSAYGYWRLAKDFANYISWYMANNGMQFQEIQFIGTDKHYQ